MQRNARPPPKANTSTPNVHLDYPDFQLLTSMEYICSDSDYSLDDIYLSSFVFSVLPPLKTRFLSCHFISYHFTISREIIPILHLFHVPFSLDTQGHPPYTSHHVNGSLFTYSHSLFTAFVRLLYIQ